MSQIIKNRPLKVCHTCRHWIYKFKGLCERTNQGVGKFWYCEDWTETPGGKPKAGNPDKAA